MSTKKSKETVKVTETPKPDIVEIIVKDIMKSLRQIRMDKGISQVKLEEMSDIPRHTISDYELGKRTPSFETVYHLADVLGYKIGIVMK